MSHFTVAVITDDINKIKYMLAPYSENLEVKPYISETKEQIIEEAKEYKERFERELKEKGLNYSDDEWKRKYINAKTDEELYEAQIDGDEKYDEQGNRLSTYNPNSKWDWYEIGGRWHNKLLVKEEVKEVIDGVASWGNLNSNNKETPQGYKWCDGARIKDIEFNKIIEFENRYNKAIRFWETYIEGQEPKTEEEKEAIKSELYRKEYYIERYKNKENYAKIESIFYTWALLDDDGWHEQGNMGWFGMADDTEESEQRFIEKFTETINKKENKDKYLVMIDCHI